MRCAVRAHDGRAAPGVDAGMHLLAHRQLALDELAIVHELAALVLLHVRHEEFCCFRLNDSVVRHLAAHLSVERRLIEHHDGVCLSRNCATQLVFSHQRHDLRIVCKCKVSGKLRLRDLLAELHAGPAEIAQRLTRFARADLLLLHELAECVLVHCHAGLTHHLDGEIDRETIGVIQLERIRAGEDLPALFGVLFKHIGEDLHPAVDGLGKALLLGLDHAGDIRLLLPQLGVLALVFVHDSVDNFIEERLIHAQELTMPRRAAQKTAQDVAAALVRRQNAVTDHERGRADVVCDDAQRHVALM